MVMTPAQIFGADLVGWWTADHGITESGGAVSAWLDRSGNGYTLSQGTSTRQPTYSATGLDGSKPAVTFAPGTDGDYMLTATDAVSLGGTVASGFALCQLASDAQSWARLLGFVANGDSADWVTASSLAFLTRDFNNQAVLAQRAFGTLDSAAITYATTQRLGSVFDGSEHTTYVDNAGTGPTASTGTFGSTGTVFVGITPDAIGSVHWSGPVSVLVIAKTAATSTQRSQMDEYLQAWPDVEDDVATAVIGGGPNVVTARRWLGF